MPDAPHALLILPQRLEDFALHDHAADLLRAPRVLALEPGRWGYDEIGRLPLRLAGRIAKRQARRLKLGREIRVLVLYDPLLLPLAEALQARHPRAELWYVPAVTLPDLDARAAALHARAERLATVFAQSEEGDTEERNRELWLRLEELEVCEFE
jgi:hypothetical protein